MQIFPTRGHTPCARTHAPVERVHSSRAFDSVRIHLPVPVFSGHAHDRSNPLHSRHAYLSMYARNLHLLLWKRRGLGPVPLARLLDRVSMFQLSCRKWWKTPPGLGISVDNERYLPSPPILPSSSLFLVSLFFFFFLLLRIISSPLDNVPYASNVAHDRGG